MFRPDYSITNSMYTIYFINGIFPKDSTYTGSHK